MKVHDPSTCTAPYPGGDYCCAEMEAVADTFPLCSACEVRTPHAYIGQCAACYADNCDCGFVVDPDGFLTLLDPESFRRILTVAPDAVLS